MQLTLFIFRLEDPLAFEVWAPRDMVQVDAPENDGALIVQDADGFAPNLVVGHNRVDSDMTLKALAARLESDASALPGAQLHEERIISGTAGKIRIVAFTHDGRPASGPLYQMTACMLAPASGDCAPRSHADSNANHDHLRQLVYLTGTCTVEQMGTWGPAFVDAAGSVRFG